MTAGLFAVLLLVPGADGVPDALVTTTQPTYASPEDGAIPQANWNSNPGSTPNLFWANAEYLMWWTEKGPLPVPLVTQGSPTDPVPGGLGQPGTQVLYGGQGVNYGVSSGMRYSAGLMLLPEAGLSLEGSWLMLEKSAQNFSVHSDGNGNPVYAQPIFNPLSNGFASETVSYPNPFGFAGGLNVSQTSRLQGWDVNLGLGNWGSGGTRFVPLLGFRSLDLLESLTVTSSFQDVSGVPGGAGLTYLGNLVADNSVLGTQDRFRTSNIFYGGQVGGRLIQSLGIFTLSVQGKVALGCTNEMVNISGSSSLTPPGGITTTVPGGLLALPSNIGRYYSNPFAVVPEVTCSLGVQLTSWARASVGYNFLYWSQVQRPGNAVDLVVNRANVPTDALYGTSPLPARPAFTFNGSDFWAQGINFSLLFSF